MLEAGMKMGEVANLQAVVGGWKVAGREHRTLPPPPTRHQDPSGPLLSPAPILRLGIHIHPACTQKVDEMPWLKPWATQIVTTMKQLRTAQDTLTKIVQRKSDGRQREDEESVFGRRRWRLGFLLRMDFWRMDFRRMDF